MTSPGPYLRAGDRRTGCQDLHSAVWTRLLALCAREGKGPAEILLHGPMGVGKTVLLRRFYWELFNQQDAETPLFPSIPPVPFRPAVWARRFLMEAAWQWIAFDRRDEEMARSVLRSLPELIDLCYDARLNPLAEALGRLSRFDDLSAEGTYPIEWAFEALGGAAERLERRVTILLDGAEHASWIERGFEHHLARVVPAIEDNGLVRRIWTSRRAGPADHPFLPPLPAAAEHWEVAPLTSAAAMGFLAQRGREAGLDYVPEVLEDHLALWGGIPRYLSNFVRQAAETPRSLTAPDHFIQCYVADVLEGPTARDLQDALHLAEIGSPYDPALLARTAHTRLQWEERGGAGAGPLGEDEERLLRRLARAGLAVYEQGRWMPSAVPALADFLHLFIARHHRGENLVRSEIALKRKRLVEAPRRIGLKDRERKTRHLAMLMHTFRLQEAPAALFQAHLSGPGASVSARESKALREAAGTQAASPAQAVGRREETIRVPYCIGAFAQTAEVSPRRGEPPPMPVVTAWCFDGPKCYRSEEILWIAHLCDAGVITTEELDGIERVNRRIAREFNVKQVTGWVISDGRFSPDALERMRSLRFHASNWESCEILGEMLMEGFRSRQEAGAVRGEEIPSWKSEARIVSAGPDTVAEKTVELMLSPQADMELVAAGALEQLAAACGFSDQAVSQMKMAVLEACLNAVERSRNPEKLVRLRYEATPARFVIVVENEGVVFDPQMVEEPALGKKIGEPYKRGWGLLLMRKFMDKVVFEPFEFGTRLRMEKRNPAAASRAEAPAAGKA